MDASLDWQSKCSSNTIYEPLVYESPILLTIRSPPPLLPPPVETWLNILRIFSGTTTAFWPEQIQKMLQE